MKPKTMKSIVSTFLMLIFVLLSAWIVFAWLAYSSHQQDYDNRSALFFSDGDLKDSDIRKYATFKPFVLDFLRRENFNAQCANGFKIVLSKNITTVRAPPIALAYLWPETVQRLELYNNKGERFFSQWIDVNLYPRDSFAHQKHFYNFHFPADQRTQYGYHIVLPGTLGLTEADFKAIASCFEKSGLVDVYTTDLQAISDANRGEYFIDTKEGFATKQADRQKITLGVYSVSVLGQRPK